MTDPAVQPDDEQPKASYTIKPENEDGTTTITIEPNLELLDEDDCESWHADVDMQLTVQQGNFTATFVASLNDSEVETLIKALTHARDVVHRAWTEKLNTCPHCLLEADEEETP